MGWFSKPKPKGPDRLELDVFARGTDGVYETQVRGEKPHRAHLVSVLSRHKRAPGWAEGRVPVDAFLIPLGLEQRENVAVEIDGVQVGLVDEKWVRLFGGVMGTAAASATRPVAFRVAAAICWIPDKGNPLKDESVNVGVRLDLEDQAELDRILAEMDDPY